jgi:hypothetical protein
MSYLITDCLNIQWGILDTPTYPFVMLFFTIFGNLVILYYTSDPNYYTGHSHGNSDGYILVYIFTGVVVGFLNGCKFRFKVSFEGGGIY